MSEAEEAEKQETTNNPAPSKDRNKFYRIRFRSGKQIHSAVSRIQNLAADEVVMIKTDHGQEPAIIFGEGALLPMAEFDKPPAFCTIARRASRDEIGKYENLLQRETQAFKHCQEHIAKLNLVMKLISVERFFNGSKIIFYFTAENRVDFRALVKDLVQEFRTRVEMRQVGVRHETQMLGGLGRCGRELCCSLFMTKFVPVSIKMAKEQSLPLNPSKISGVCNRLLCCLTHEFDTYKHLKKGMPKLGKTILYEGKKYKVRHCNTIKGEVSLVAIDDHDESLQLSREEWDKVETVGRPKGKVEMNKTPAKHKSKKNKGHKKAKR